MAEADNRFFFDAQLAWWFKLNPFTLTPAQKIGLMGNLNRMKAQQIIFEGGLGRADPERCYDVTLLATGDKEQAEEAMRARMAAQQWENVNRG